MQYDLIFKRKAGRLLQRIHKKQFQQRYMNNQQHTQEFLRQEDLQQHQQPPTHPLNDYNNTWCSIPDLVQPRHPSSGRITHPLTTHPFHTTLPFITHPFHDTPSHNTPFHKKPSHKKTHAYHRLITHPLIIPLHPPPPLSLTHIIPHHQESKNCYPMSHAPTTTVLQSFQFPNPPHINVSSPTPHKPNPI